ncbi:MAG: nitrate reductase, partial [Anaerolineae bacterium]|nr:nitrate reductase [Anaerolineae bacterium]
MNQIWSATRLFIIGLAAVGLVVGLALVVLTLGKQHELAQPPTLVDALASSTDDCVTCHREESPGIVEQYAYSAMVAAEVTCRDCHEVPSDYPAAVEHEGTYVLQSPTPARCEQCHETEVAQFNASRHGLPSYVAYAGSEHLSTELLAQYQSIAEGSYAPDKSRNALYELEGPDVTYFACETCHNVGLPRADGSVGQCQKCHLRHTFSLEQVRKPETCNACHIGPDHPQWEIYQESPHGIAYMTGGHEWNWDAEPGELSVMDLPAATCATCHISGFGATGTSHDVGERLTWYLFAPVSTRRP